jgi:outer membrane protein TolC
MLDSQFEVTAMTAESLAGSAETMRSMMDAGMTNRAGVSQMEAAAFSAEASLYDIAYNIRNVENALCTLLGETPHVIDRSTLIEQVLPADINIGIPVQLLANRPDVRMAEYALMQAYYATAAARSALYPSLTLNGILGWTNDAGSAIINPGGLLLSAAASIAAPIFNGGKLRAQVKIAEAQQQEALLTFQQTLLNAGAEVNTLLAQVQTANSKMDIREQQINSLIMAVESTELLMQHGSTTYLEVLTAQQNLLSGRLSPISDYFEEMQAIVNLYAALGGGREPIVEDDNSKSKRNKKSN